MASWLWVDKLDPKNDWLELKSFSFGSVRSTRVGGAGTGTGADTSQKESNFTLDPGRFATRFFSWFYKGEDAARLLWKLL